MLNFEGVRCLKIRKQENTSNAVAFFDDSVVDGLCLKNVDTYSSSGRRPQHVLHIFRGTDLKQYQQVALCVGGNCFSAWKDQPSMALDDQHTEIVRLLNHANQFTEVSFISLLPRDERRFAYEKCVLKCYSQPSAIDW